mmetsp:Transcript_63379/g.141293  ORF Transcript_63379/g.141293 Transcript_63379/m.141293 type:complete len:276 (-) Transcript_63379:189-1016(-)
MHLHRVEIGADAAGRVVGLSLPQKEERLSLGVDRAEGGDALLASSQPRKPLGGEVVGHVCGELHLVKRLTWSQLTTIHRKRLLAPGDGAIGRPAWQSAHIPLAAGGQRAQAERLNRPENLACNHAFGVDKPGWLTQRIRDKLLLEAVVAQQRVLPLPPAPIALVRLRRLTAHGVPHATYGHIRRCRFLHLIQSECFLLAGGQRGPLLLGPHEHTDRDLEDDEGDERVDEGAPEHDEQVGRVRQLRVRVIVAREIGRRVGGLVAREVVVGAPPEEA